MPFPSQNYNTHITSPHSSPRYSTTTHLLCTLHQFLCQPLWLTQKRTMTGITPLNNIKRLRSDLFRTRNHAFLPLQRNRIVLFTQDIRAGDSLPWRSSQGRCEREVGMLFQGCDVWRCGGVGEVVVEDLFWVGGIDYVALNIEEYTVSSSYSSLTTKTERGKGRKHSSRKLVKSGEVKNSHQSQTTATAESPTQPSSSRPQATQTPPRKQVF